MREGRGATVLALVSVALTGCADPATIEGGSGIPNPASEHCVDEGGRLDIREDAGGGEYGVCMFDDGSECEEWAFHRGECRPGSG